MAEQNDIEANMKLTKSLIDKMTYGKTVEEDGSGKKIAPQDIRWDDEIKGFGIRVFPSGGKKFVISYRHLGRKHIMQLGAYGVLTLDQARNMARKKLVDVIEQKDPLEDRMKQRRGEKIKDLCGVYIERYAKLHKKSWKKDESRINRIIIPRWGNHMADSINRSDVAELHSQLGEMSGHYEANRVVELLSKMFELAQKWGFIKEGLINPAHKIDKFKEEKRDRWVTAEELPRLAEAIDGEGNYYARMGIWLFLLTGLRKNELLQAQWSDVDMERKELRIPETKAGRVHYIPLSNEAMAILEKLPRFKDNPYILPGHIAEQHLVNLDKPWQRIRRSAGIDDVRLHDLRRTVGSWLAQSGNSLHLIGRVLNHSNTSTTAVYARFGQDNVRDALEANGRQIMGIAGKRPLAEVVPMRGVK